MTLDKAIEVYEFWANAHERDAEYHRPLGYSHETIANVAEMQAREERQIAEWLKELKAYRETYPYGVDRFNGADTPQTETQTETQNSNLTFEKRTMRDCYNCKRYETEGECVECHYKPKTEPQTDVYDYKGNGKWERSE